MKIKFTGVFLYVCLSMVALACAEDGTDNSSDKTGDSGTKINPTSSDCPGRYNAEPVVEPSVTVGFGTAASCSEEALRNAVSSVNASGGGTVLFNCGQEYTFSLSSPLVFKSSLVPPLKSVWHPLKSSFPAGCTFKGN